MMLLQTRRPELSPSTTSGATVEIDRIRKTYGSYVALDDVSLKIRPGEFMSFLGPSGSGKTTTLNVIAGFTGHDGGVLKIDGREIDRVPPHRRNIGVVFQHYALFPHMTVAENIAYPLRQRRVGRAERRARVGAVLEKVELSALAGRYPAELSGGQQQRVALARAMVFAPGLLLLDEPLGALDKKLREALQLEIRRIHRELGSTFVFVTHDQEEALVLSDRIAVFNKGRIEQVASGEELYRHPKTLFVGQFIGESTVLRGAHEVSGGETVLTVAGMRVRAAARPGAGTGAQCLLLRPEDMRLCAPETGAAAGENALRARLREKIYLGASVKYEAVLADGTVATARMPVSGPSFGSGATVDLVWPADRGTLLDCSAC